jgi:hypothetical protein
MPSHTAPYSFIESALAARAQAFAALEARMDAFAPRPPASFAVQRENLARDIRSNDPRMTPEDLNRFVDSQIGAFASHDFQFSDTFLDEFSSEAVSIAILSHTLAEAVINAALALGLEHVGKPALFDVLDKAGLRDKWVIGPQAFLTGYLFPTSEALHERLVTLVRRRNGYVHSKITVHDDAGNRVIDGTKDAGMPMDQNARRLIGSFLTLPTDLHTFLLAQISDQSLRFKLKYILQTTQSIR